MKKNTGIIVGIVAIVVIVGGALLLSHKSSKNTTASTQSSVAAVNNAILKTKTDSALGQYLTDPNGKPLYTYDNDTTGVSNCTGSCLAQWPAYTATSTAGLPAGISTIKRSDNNQIQFTYNGKPLYFFVNDSANSAPTGNGVGAFSIAKPAAASSPATGTTSTPSQSNTGSTSSNSYNYPY